MEVLEQIESVLHLLDSLARLGEVIESEFAPTRARLTARAQELRQAHEAELEELRCRRTWLTDDDLQRQHDWQCDAASDDPRF